MKKYSAVLFDLCDTIMPYRSDNMPMVEVKDMRVRSTTPLLYDFFKKQNQRTISFEAFHMAFFKITAGIFTLRKKSEKEILSEARFSSFLDCLGVERGDAWNTIHHELMRKHLMHVAACLELPPIHRTLLKNWSRDYPLGIVSNFDDTATVYHVLTRENMMDFFESILISAEFGFRKPGQKIFLEACLRLDKKPEEVLFVGDSWDHDVLGAQSVRMDVAWLNPKNLPHPDTCLKPTYQLRELEDLNNIL